MIPFSDIPQAIVSFCDRCSKGLSKINDTMDQIEFMRKALPEMQENKSLFTELLSGVIEGAKYPDLRHATMFDNELFLCQDPVLKFSFRMFLWAPGEHTVVHDHGSWGVIGPVTGKLDVIDYDRKDGGADEAHAWLVERERITLGPGETAYTLPLDDGIHSVGNPTDEVIVSLSLYGKPLPRGYIKGFDVTGGRAYRILAPQTRKKLLIASALSGLDKKAGENALRKMREQSVEIFKEAGTENFGKLT